MENLGTKSDFLEALAAELREHYPWARNDPTRLDRFMAAWAETLRTEKRIVALTRESHAAHTAWRAIGGKGYATYEGLRALAD